MTRGRTLNLTAVLAAVALADLLLYRLLTRLFLPQQPRELLARAASAAGRFVFHLGGVLGLLVVVTGLAVALRRNDPFPRSMRFAVATIALFFSALAAAGVFLLHDRFLMHLKTSHAFLAWFILIALWRGPAPARAKIGASLFALPPMLQAVALFSERMGWAGPFAGELARAAELCALVACALAPYLLTREPPSFRRRALGLVAGVALLSAMVVTLMVRFDLVQALALYGLRLDIPPLVSAGAVMYVGLIIAALVGLTMAVVWAFADRGGPRLIGYGLVLVLCAGFQALAPNQILFATAGLLALAGGISRPAAEPLPAPAAA